MNQYRDRVANSGPLNIISGDLSDRLSGLDRLLAMSSGLSVYDVGCHVGVVLEAFGKAGASPLSGCDFHPPSLAEARARLPHASIIHHDLVEGAPEFRADVVLYLGVHHRLQEQIEHARAEIVALDVASRADRFLAIRTPTKFLDPLMPALADRGHVLLYRDMSNDRVGELAVFQAASAERS